MDYETGEYEKPSRRKQWHEREERPMVPRDMTRTEMEEHRRNLVTFYQCEDKDITFTFERIHDEYDEDRHDFMWIKYMMNTISFGVPTLREVFSVKLPIPEDIRCMAVEIRKQRTAVCAATQK